MPPITTEQLQTISVKTVEDFLNNRTPLSEGLAKQASLYELNSEQIQRAVEATNSICYLKLVKVAEDRTIEFPLCKTAEVMAHIVLPGVEKTAKLMTKQASSKEPKIIPKEESLINISSKTEMYHLLTKMASRDKRLLSEAKDELVVTMDALEKAASILAKDPKAQIKLSMLGVTETGMEKVAGIEDQISGSFIFKEADLKVAKQVLGLTKKAAALQSSISKYTELQKQAELAKQSFISVLSKGVGYLAGKAVSVPGKVIGKVFKNTGTNIKNIAGDIGRSPDKKLGIPKKLGVFGVAGTALDGGLSATMYQPSKEKDIYHQMVHAGPY